MVEPSLGGYLRIADLSGFPATMANRNSNSLVRFSIESATLVIWLMTANAIYRQPRTESSYIQEIIKGSVPSNECERHAQGICISSALHNVVGRYRLLEQTTTPERSFSSRGTFGASQRDWAVHARPSEGADIYIRAGVQRIHQADSHRPVHWSK
jgi:hypothetical protein